MKSVLMPIFIISSAFIINSIHFLAEGHALTRAFAQTMKKGSKVTKDIEVNSEFQGLKIRVETKDAKTLQDVRLTVLYQVFVPVGSYVALVEGFERGQIAIYAKDLSTQKTYLNTTARTGGISEPHFVANDSVGLQKDVVENQTYRRQKSFRLGDQIENLPKTGEFEVYVEFGDYKSNIERFKL